MKKQNVNPYLPSYEYIPDGEPRVFDDRLYIFGSHDRYGSSFFCLNDYVLWSAPLNDLTDWKCHGVIFEKKGDPLNRDGTHELFAPDCIEGKDGRYYLYYCPNGAQSVGVAVCDRPDGRYRFLNHVKDKEGRLLGRRDHDPYPFDPAILIDDDGKIYLYLGFSPDPSWAFLKTDYDKTMLENGAYVAELEEDMCTIKEGPQRIVITDCPDPGHDFFEASSIRKINGLYYFIYSSWNSHELCYATGKDPRGPFTYRGILHDNGDIGLDGRTEKNRVTYTGNNHGSLIQLNGDWYVFGHRQTNYCVYARQGIAEKVTIQEDGFIPQAELTSQGLNGGPLESRGKYGTYIACHLTSKEGAVHYLDDCSSEEYKELRQKHPVFHQDGEDREGDPDQHIINMCDGATAGFKYFKYREKIDIHVRTKGDAGIFEIRFSLDGPVEAEIVLKESDAPALSETVWLEPPHNESFPLFFTYRGKGYIDFFEFELL